MDRIDRVLWTGSLGDRPFQEQIGAAAAGGFGSLAVLPSWGRAAREGRGLAEDHGVDLGYLDTVTRWAPQRYPAAADASTRARFNFSVEECLDLATAVGARSLLAVGAYDACAVETDDLVRGFRDLCDRAADRGMWVDLEAIPFLGLARTEEAWRIVREADRPNSGLMVDTWHFVRGGEPLSLLEGVPGERLTGLQIADGPERRPPVGLGEECLRLRALPGEGGMPILPIVRTLLAKGGLRSVGPEIFSDEVAAMPGAEAGRRLGLATAGTLSAA